MFVCPAWHRIAPAIHDVLCDRVLVAHGAAEHLRMLAAHLPGWRPPLVLDTARLARSVWPRLSGGYGLDRLVTHAGSSRLRRSPAGGATAPGTTRG